MDNVKKIRDEVLEKCRDILDAGSSDAMSYRYTGKKSKTDVIEEEPEEKPVVFQPKVFKHRATEHYLPAKVKA